MDKHARIRTRILAVALAAACVTAFTPVPSYAVGDVDTMKSEQAQYAAQQQKNDSELASLRSDKSQKEAYGAALQSQLETIEEQINSCSNQMTDLDLQMQQAQDTISAKQKQIDADTRKLKQRLCALYMTGGAGNLQILLSASDTSDLSDKAEAISVVTQHDTTLINRLKSEKEAVKQAKDTISTKRQQAAKVKESYSGKQQQLSSTLSETNQFLKDIGQQEVDLQDQNASLDVKAAKLSASIASWQQTQQAAASSTDNTAGKSADSPSSGSASSSSSAASSSTADSTSPAASSATHSSASRQSSNYSSRGRSSVASSTSSASHSSSSSSSSFSNLIGEAEKHLGTPYVMGGYSPSGFDCSGFVCWVFSHCGYNLSRTTAQGIYDQCQKISVSEARSGDIVFFTGTYSCGETITHVGIYTGSGTMIHAGSPVQYSSIDTSYWRQHFYAFGRL